MLSIRLRRVGKRNAPQYRLIVCDKTQDPLGDYLENLGTYNPRANPSEINFKADRIKAWMDKGAQPSETVWNLLVDQNIVKGDKKKTVRLSDTRKEKLNLKKKEAEKAAEEAKAAEVAKAAEAKAAEEAARAQAEAPAEDAAPAEVSEAPAEDAAAPAEEAPKE